MALCLRGFESSSSHTSDSNKERSRLRRAFALGDRIPLHTKNMEMKISKTQIEKRMQSKTDSTLTEAIIKLKKTNLAVAKELARPKRKWVSINLDAISKIGGDVVIAGKVLGVGNLEKAKKIVAWGASAKAIERIKSAGGSFVSILDEMKKNPELKGLELVK